MKLEEELIRCREWIQSALNKGGNTHEFKDIVDGIISGNMQLWLGANGCAITEIVVYPNKKVLHVFLAGGDKGLGIEQITDMHDDAIEFGKQQGCVGMTVTGRKGWKKVLQSRGWSEQFTTLLKEF
jgi:hypothetical protein|tara:strand:+ start:897 stop:1274 length:378 start_codon:yes stop_codon:yes gene_type:complete